MAHVRTQIRNELKTILTDGLPATYDVFGSRKYARNHRRGTALVDIRFLNVNISQETMGDDRKHEASFYLRVQRDATEETLDDALDVDEVLLTQIIEAHDWSDLLEEDPELIQVNFADDAESSTPLGSIILRYDVEYRIDKTNPEEVKD